METLCFDWRNSMLHFECCAYKHSRRGCWNLNLKKLHSPSSAFSFRDIAQWEAVLNVALDLNSEQVNKNSSFPRVELQPTTVRRYATTISSKTVETYLYRVMLSNVNGDVQYLNPLQIVQLMWSLRFLTNALALSLASIHFHVELVYGSVYLYTVSGGERPWATVSDLSRLVLCIVNIYTDNNTVWSDTILNFVP